MGQKFGKAKLVSAADPFVNLPKKAIQHTWQMFNDIADGFGINKEELEEICADLKEELNISRLGMLEFTASLFFVLDTDSNGLIDALEFIGAISSVSGMRLNEVLEFVLRCYDFDGTEFLSVDEVTLALKSLSTGLSKLESLPAPREDKIEFLVSTMFVTLRELNNQDDLSFRISTLVDYLAAHPDIKSWHSHFEVIEYLDRKSSFNIEMLYMLRNLTDSEYAKDYGNETTVEWDLTKRAYNKGIASSEPWHSAVPLLVPLQYANSEFSNTLPEYSLQVSWVYGYQSEKARNNVYYTAFGSIVYHVGRFGVVYNMLEHSQTVFTGHEHEIIALTIHPSGILVASADFAPTVRLIVWNSVTLDVLFADKNMFLKGVSSMSFSNDGKLLIAVGNDFDHLVAIYRWESNEIVFSAYSGPNNCLACCFRKDGVVAVGGDTYMSFWYPTEEGFLRRQGIFRKHVQPQSITCIVQSVSSDTLVTGTELGQIFLWVDRNCVRNVQGHDGVICSMFSSDHGILTGGKDQRIRLWTHKLEPGASFDLTFFGIFPSIRSVCLAVDGSSIVFGTLGGNIFEISATDGSDLRGGPLACSHYTGKLTNLGIHPSKHEFATVGDDKHLRIWDMLSHTLLKVASFDGEVKCCTYGPLGDIIAVGLGGEKTSNGKSGAFVIINEDDLSVLHEAHDSASPITLVSFSPEGETLAVACEDGAVFLYAVPDEYELIGRCVRHTTPVLHLDFSVDGEWIRTNSLAKEIGFFNADDASYQSNLASMRDIQWATQSCIYSWHVKSTHRTPYEDDIVLSLHTSSPSSSFVACGTSTGFVRLHSFPCIADDSECQRYPAHAGAVSSVRFSFCGEYLVSLGLLDRSVILWKVKPHRTDIAQPQTSIDLPETDDYRAEAREMFDLVDDFMPSTNIDPPGRFFDKLNLEKSAGAGSAQSAVDAWFGSVVAPTNIGTINHAIPDVSLKLAYIHGYHSQDLRSCVKYNSVGDVVFVAASVGVVMNKTNSAQDFYQLHTDSISAITSTRDGRLVATGQQGHDAIVAVWDSRSLQTIRILPDRQICSITALAFSNNTVLLAVASLDEDHTISVYNWKERLLIARAQGGGSRIFDLSFSERDTALLSCGVKSIKLWTIANRCMTSSVPALNALGDLQSFLCCTYFAGLPIVGAIDGSLYILSAIGDILRRNVKAHDGEICSIHTSLDNKQLVSGGKDGTIRIWNTNYDCLKEIQLESILSYRSPRIRSVCFNGDGTLLLVGTRGSEVLEVNIRSGTMVNSKPLLQGHGHRELWGLSCHPKKEEFITTGDDGTLRFWDLKNFVMTKKINIDASSRAVTYNSDGSIIAIGFGGGGRSRSKSTSKDGAFIVMNSVDNKIIHEGKDSNESIRVIKFSNDGKLLAVGSEDSRIYLYNVKDKYTRRSVVSSHRAPVLHIDFTADSQFFTSVDSTNRIFYTESSSGTNVPSPAALRDEKWATWTCPVGWPVQGFWRSQPSNSFPCCAQRSWSGMLLACGNTCGRVFLSHNPCIREAGFSDQFGHAGAISRIGWSAGDSYVVTVGSIDNVIMQWKCVYDAAKESGDEGGRSCEDSDVDKLGGQEFNIATKSKSVSSEVNPQWTTNIAPPSDLQDDDSRSPNVRSILEVVHGARISDCRQTFAYNEDGNVTYAAAACCVVYDRDKHEQHVFCGETGGIICMDIDSSGKVGASGSKGSDPFVYFWDSRTAKLLDRRTGIHKNGISSVKFSSDSSYLVTLGQDAMNSIVVLRSDSKRWNDAYVFASCGVSFLKMFWVLYADGNECPIVVGGNRCMFFFRINGKGMERSRGVFGRRRKLQPLLCGVVAAETSGGSGSKAILTGTVTGQIYQWLGRKVNSVISAHDAPVTALSRCRNGYASGAKDGLIKLWTKDLKLIYTFNSQTFDPVPYISCCNSLSVNCVNSRLLIGMKGGDCYEISLDTNSVSLICESHGYGELHALSLNQLNHDEYVTGGDDGMIRVWSLSQKRCLRKSNLGYAARAVCWSPDGMFIVVGLGGDPKNSAKDGTFSILNADTLDVQYEDRKAKKWISDIKFGNAVFVLMSRDGCLYVHDSTKFNLLRKLEIPSKAQAGVVNGDFNITFDYIRIGTTQDEVFYYSIGGELVTSPMQIRNLEWASHSCMYTWMTKGCWPSWTAGIRVIAIDVSPIKKLIVAGFDDGTVYLFRYPCQDFGAGRLIVRGVSLFASKVMFSSDGMYLLILDCVSRAILQYQISY